MESSSNRAVVDAAVSKGGSSSMMSRFKISFSLLLVALAVVFAFPVMAFAQDAGGSSPTIQSDKDDYPPGATVTLTGSGWQPGESVHIYVNDDQGKTWSRDADVTANANGNITDSFNLPDWFVATYSVKATGASGAVANTSFTDGNVTFSPTRFPSTGSQSINAGTSWDFNVTLNKQGGGSDPTVNTPFVVTNPVGDSKTPATCGAAATQIPSSWLSVVSPALPRTISASVPFTMRVKPPSGTNGTYTGRVNLTTTDGGSQTFDLCLKVVGDSTPPTTSASATSNGSDYTQNTWTNKAVTVNLSATDDAGVKEIVYSIDGGANTTVSGSSASVNVSTEGTKTISYFARDAAGNEESAKTFTVKIDKTAPAISGSDINDTAWRNTDRTASFTASDAGSGLANSADASFSLTASAESTKDAGGNAVPTKVSKTVTDLAGNSSTRTLSALIDRTKPVISDQDVNNTTWRNTDLSQDFTASDGLSGLNVATDSSFTLTASAESANATTPTTVSKAVTDKAGNAATRTVSAKIDKTKPAVNCGSAPSGWSQSDVSVRCQPTDGLSGLANPANDGDFNLSTSVATGNETDAATTGSRSLSDAAGNTVTAGPITGIQVDKKAPNTTAAAGTYNGGWTNQSVTVTLNANDGGSGVKATEYSIDGGAFQPYPSGGISVAGDGDHTIRYRSSDSVNNQEQDKTFTVKVDKTAPSISDLGATTNPNGAGWYKTDVTNRFAASDTGGSGLSDACKTNFPANAAGENVQSKTTGGEGSAVKASSDGCADVAGNVAASVDSVAFKVDKTKPVISRDAVKGGTQGLNGWYKSAVQYGFTASDPNGASASGLAAADQAFTKNTGTDEGPAVTVGSGTVTDLAGNVSDAIVSADLKIDTKAPVITNNGPTTQPNANGWYNGNVINRFSASDPNGTSGSGLANAADADISKTTQGEGTAVKVTSGQVSDNAGNVAASVDSVAFKIDKTAPIVAASVSPDRAASRWYNKATGAPTVSYRCSDALSGLSGTCPAGRTFGEGENQSDSSGDVSDLAGNKASASVDNIDVDLTAPTKPQASFGRAPEDSAGGYFKDTVTVGYGGSTDALSGIKSVSSNQTFNTTGSHDYSGVAEDNAGNASDAASGTVKVDASAPVVNPDSVVDSTWRKSPLSQAFTASDTGSGLADSADASFSLTASAESQGANAPTVAQRTVSDKVGHSVTRSVSALIDLTKPNISASTTRGPASSGWYNNETGAPVVRFGCSDALSGIAAGACPTDHTIMTEGADQGYTDTVSDRAGNSNSAGVSGLKIDLTAPNAAGAPDLLASSDSGDTDDNLTNDHTPTFDITAEAGSTVRLYGKKEGATSATLLGSGPATNGVATITSGQTLSDGTYAVHAEVTDQAGNVSSTADIKVTIVTVDTVAPDAPTGLDMAAASDSGGSNSDDITSDASPVISGTAEKGSDVKLYDGTTPVGSARADATGGAWSITTSALGEGVHSLTAKATDAAGNTSVASGALRVTVDKTAPAIKDEGPTTQPNAAGWYNTDVTNNFSASDGLSGFAGQSDPYTFGKTSSTEGSAVKIASGAVTDKAGNSAASIDSAAFKIDKTAPGAPNALDLLPASDTGASSTDNVTQDTTPTFSVKAEAGSTVKLYKGTDNTPIGSAVADASGVATVTTNVLADGTYTIDATATDEAGNVSALSSTIQVTIDVTVDNAAPTITNVPSDKIVEATSAQGARVDYASPTANDAADGSVAVDCQPASGTVFALGQATVNCSATDKAGNKASASFTVTVRDTTAPALNLPENKTVEATGPNGAAVAFARSASDIVDGAVPVSCSIGTNPVQSGSTFGLGTTRVDCSATDKAGNKASDSFTVTVADSTAPDTQILSGPTGWINNRSATFSWSGSDLVTGKANLVYSYKLDDNAWSAYSGDTSVTLQGLAEGPHTFYVRAKDASGNADPSEATQAFKVDTIAPEIRDLGPTTQPNAAGWYNSPVTNVFSASDGGSGLADVNQANFRVTSGASEEGKVVNIGSGVVKDVAGNTSPGIVRAFQIDLTKPVITLNAPAEGARVDICSGIPAIGTTATSLSYLASDPLSGMASSSDRLVKPTTASGVGAYTYTVDAADVAGNADTKSRNYSVVYGAAYGGVLQPINLGTQRSVFKLGSTIPVKFKLMCGTQPVSNAVASLYVQKQDNTVDGAINETIFSDPSTAGTTFRYDATGGQYIFNLSTKSAYTNPNGSSLTFGAGTYQLTIRLDDGTTRTALIDIGR